FPAAQILTNNSPPDNSILTAAEQYIQISNVRPVGDAQALKTAMVPVPEKIARFYEVNDVTRFIYDRPIYKGPIDKDNEFKSLWIERTKLEISNQLPGILRWFEVKHKSVHEITPVEFACETMNNVGKELWDLIVQYRTEPKRNINPFSMRLQGIIDANVMGGISKYQEAFFSEQFLKSPQGHGQQTNVQKLKALILEQIQVLEQALELHGTLAPPNVQPLHNRLLERFSQLKQSLSGLGRLKRQHSESIVNTPLPPLPTEKRTMSLGNPSLNTGSSNYYGVYEQDDIYTRPGDTLRPVESGHSLLNSYQTLSNESMSIPEITRDKVPPVPNRPRSQNFMPAMDGPEVPPKRNANQVGSPSAPPLPPRGITPDKRASNPSAINDFSSSQYPSAGSMPRRPLSAHHQQQQQHEHGQKYSVVDISFDDPEADQAPHSLTSVGETAQLNVIGYGPNDFRDSGISTTSSHDLNNLNNLSEESSSNSVSTVHHRDHCRLISNGSMDSAYTINTTLNINHRENSASSFDMDDLPMPPPPPIPPKSLNIIATADSSSLEEQHSTNPNTIQNQNHTASNHSHALNHPNHLSQHSTHNHSQSHQQNGIGASDNYITPKKSDAASGDNASASESHNDGGTF
ncbi:PREDICTED: dedicator of cytokinesis protein 4-like, partial [Rhagoletis zephyria]|uniref:dedicator of cytokinesis protein 4-like n=1 Tax=Rhagoletis zephyria TaxID=28612 RepID=UPI000811A9CC